MSIEPAAACPINAPLSTGIGELLHANRIAAPIGTVVFSSDGRAEALAFGKALRPHLRNAAGIVGRDASKEIGSALPLFECVSDLSFVHIISFQVVPERIPRKRAGAT